MLYQPSHLSPLDVEGYDTIYQRRGDQTEKASPPALPDHDAIQPKGKASRMGGLRKEKIHTISLTDATHRECLGIGSCLGLDGGGTVRVQEVRTTLTLALSPPPHNQQDGHKTDGRVRIADGHIGEVLNVSEVYRFILHL